MLGSRDVEPSTRLDQQPEDGRADCERTHVEHRGHAIADETDLTGGEPGDELNDELEAFSVGRQPEQRLAVPLRHLSIGTRQAYLEC